MGQVTALDQLPPRKAIPAKWKAEAHAREGRCCYLCGVEVPLRGPGVEYDHRLPLWLHGLHAVGNIFPACVPCHASKTRREAPVRAKVNRIRKVRAGEKRKTKQIQSRGFERQKVKKPWPKRALSPEQNRYSGKVPGTNTKTEITK